jgi:putative oxidoreductase
MAVWQSRMLSILRIMSGLMFMEHGLSKLFNFPPGNLHPSFPVLLWFAAVLECFGGGLVALGLLTRAAAFLLSGEMAIAYFMAHAPRSFFPLVNGGEAAVLYCFVFLYLALAGGGAWSVDHLRASAGTSRVHARAGI